MTTCSSCRRAFEPQGVLSSSVCPDCQRSNAQVSAQTRTTQAQTRAVVGAVGQGLGRVERAVDQGNAITAQGFAEMHALQEQGNALQAQGNMLSAGQLLVMQRHAAEQREQWEEEMRKRAFFADSAGHLQEALLEVKAVNRRLAQGTLDPLAAWIRLETVSRRTRWIRPDQVDPAQRRDLVDLRDLIAQGFESAAATAGDVSRLERWIALLERQSRTHAQLEAARDALAQDRRRTGVALPVPSDEVELHAQLGHAEAMLHDLSEPRPLSPVASRWAESDMSKTSHHATSLPDAEAQWATARAVLEAKASWSPGQWLVPLRPDSLRGQQFLAVAVLLSFAYVGIPFVAVSIWAYVWTRPVLAACRTHGIWRNTHARVLGQVASDVEHLQLLRLATDDAAACQAEGERELEALVAWQPELAPQVRQVATPS